jgi:hypothetical protein
MQYGPSNSVTDIGWAANTWIATDFRASDQQARRAFMTQQGHFGFDPTIA